MPITLDKKLPAVDALKKENIFVMDDKRADTQEIRPIKVLIVNLMPTKEVTEAQLLRYLSNTPLQLKLDFIHMATHASKNTKLEHLETFYKTFEDIQDNYYDGLIITGAPVETLPFEQVDYWSELTQIFEWKKTHVYSTLHLCWGAQAGLYYHYGVDKVKMSHKLSGIYQQEVTEPLSPLMRGFDDQFLAPHSRHTDILESDVRNKTNLQILAKGEQVGLSILASRDLREVYSFGHLEYDRDTLKKEYDRDLAAGKHPSLPENYFPEGNPKQTPMLRWSLVATTFFSNWLNYGVYQETPYHLEDLALSTANFGCL